MQGPRCKSPPDQQEIVMSTLPDRPHTALLVIDVQAGVVADTYQRDAVVTKIGTLVDTDLEDVLAKAGVGRLVVTGAQTDGCIRATIPGAVGRGYDVTLVGDGHTTEDQSACGAPRPDRVIAHTNL
jgi:nicotinamidase-related amidase